MASGIYSDGAAVAPRALALAPLLLALLAGACGGPPASGSAPVGHVLLITLDTLRADHLGAYGHPDAGTPALDGLAEEGVLFENAYTTCNVTGPSHASIMTGLYPERHGMLGNAWRLDESVDRLALLLAGAGFDTAAFVSSAVLATPSGLAHGFAEYDQEFLRNVEFERTLQRRGDETVDAALRWLSSWRERNPEGRGRFFLWVHLFDAHAPYDPPEPFWPADAPRPASDAATLEAIHAGTLALDAATLEQLRGLYRAEVRFVDHQIARLLDALEAAGLRSRTLIAVTSDHGEELAEHFAFFEHNRSLYEGVTKVPLIVSDPRLRRVPGAARRVAAPVQGVDLMPTLLERAGVPLPAAELDGRSLVPWLRGDGAGGPRPFALTQQPHNPGFYPRGDAFAWVSGGAKLVLSEKGAPALYELAADPGETRDRYDPADAAQAALRREALAQLGALRGRGDASRRHPIALPAQREMLRALGYAAEDGAGADGAGTD